MSYFNLEGKTAVIVGGSGVLGGALAEGLADHGAAVAIVGRDWSKIEQAVARLQARGASAQGFQADAAIRAEVERLAEATFDCWGKVDVLVNCAGVNSKTPFMQINDEEWQQIMDTNAKGVFLASQIFGARMLAQGQGSIINISSVSSGPPLSGVFTYSASKAAINNMTQFLARELAPKIRVNAVIPGFFPAEQNRKILTAERIQDICRHTPMGRLGVAEELQGAVVWLASERASGFVTGALIPVDGGFTAMTI